MRGKLKWLANLMGCGRISKSSEEEGPYRKIYSSATEEKEKKKKKKKKEKEELAPVFVGKRRKRYDLKLEILHSRTFKDFVKEYETVLNKAKGFPCSIHEFNTMLQRANRELEQKRQIEEPSEYC